MAKIATFYDHIVDITKQENISMAEALQEARRLGIELLEVSQGNLAGRLEEAAGELAAAGMGISTIPVFFDFRCREKSDQLGSEALKMAEYLDADRLLVIPGFYGPEDGEAEREQYRERAAEEIDRLADRAAGRGVRLTMEEFDNALSPISTAEGVRWFLDRCPGLSCTFDTGNFRFASQDEHAAYELLRDRIDHVHLKDRAYEPEYGSWALKAADGKELYPCPVGAGELDLTGIIDRLKADGYDGIYSVEHYGAPAALDFLKQSVAWVKAHI